MQVGNDVRDAVRGFSGTFAPVDVPISYRAAIVMMLLIVLVNFAVYFGMIAGLAWLAVNIPAILGPNLSGRRLAAVIGCYLFIGIVGYALLRPIVLFLRRPHPRGVEVTSRDEPDLYAFVMTIAGLVDAPLPRRVMVFGDVNAAAGLGSFFTGDLTLYLGLPLGSLDCRQLAGIVAHELGHFSQRSGMRVTFLARRLENAYPLVMRELIRVRLGGNLLFDIITFHLPYRIMWLMYHLTRPLARILDRQLERHADRYEARVAGSDVFAGTAMKLAELKYAAREVWSGMRAGRRVSSMSQAIIDAHDHQSPAFRKAIHAEVMAGVTRWQDTHPADIERITYAKAENAPGVYTYRGPARELFRDFATLDRKATMLMLSAQ